MHPTRSHAPARSLTVAAAALLAACAEPTATSPRGGAAARARSAAGESARTVATLRQATARYHSLDAAVADGFVFLHGCEVRGDEGPAGMLYVHMARLTDGRIDPALPDALLYEPRRNGHAKLVGVELAVPYALWPEAAPPTFLGATFQREDEFGVYGLHAWVWKENPEGMFAETNPRLSCGGE